MWTAVLCRTCMSPKWNTQVKCAEERFDRMEELHPTRNSRKNNLRWTLDSDGHEEPQMVSKERYGRERILPSIVVKNIASQIVVKELCLCERNFPSMPVKWTVPQVALGSDTWWGDICLDYTHQIQDCPQDSHALCWSSAQNSHDTRGATPVVWWLVTWTRTACVDVFSLYQVCLPGNRTHCVIAPASCLVCTVCVTFSWV